MKTSPPPSEHVVSEILSHFSRERAELLPALDELNSRLGYLARETIESAARHFGVPPYAVYGAATFYSMWNVGSRPPEVVHLCDDGPCHAMGAAGVRRALEKAGVEVRRTSCIGQCGCGPVVVTEDGTLYRHVTPRGARAILDGKPPKPFALADGIVGIELDDLSHSLIRNLGKINPESLPDAVNAGAYQALKKALAMTSEQVVNEIVNSGLQGRGGAGFPIGLKMRFTAGGKSADGVAYVVCNADESEPGTFKDRILIEGDPHAVIEGMTIAAYAQGKPLSAT